MSAQTSRSKGKKRTQRGASVLVPGARPTISLTPVFAYFAQGAGTAPDIVRAAYGQFVRSLGLTGDAEDARVRRAFTTWFVLEHRLTSGKTPLEHYALCAPRHTELERAQAEVLRQVAHTQRFGLFWVRAADRHAGTLSLEDARDGTVYTVHDRVRAAEVADAPSFERSLAQEGKASLMAAHLAEVAGEWRLPAGVLALRYDLDEAAFAASFKQTWDTGQDIGFVDMALVELGGSSSPADRAAAAVASALDGADATQFACEDSEPEPAVPQRPAPRVVLDGPASEVPGMTVAPERREGALMDAARLYGLLARDFSLAPTWADVIETVRGRAEEEEAADVVRHLFGPNAEALAPLDDAAFQDMLYCIILAWNLLPHDVFDGKSPAEIYNGR